MADRSDFGEQSKAINHPIAVSPGAGYNSSGYRMTIRTRFNSLACLLLAALIVGGVSVVAAAESRKVPARGKTTGTPPAPVPKLPENSLETVPLGPSTDTRPASDSTGRLLNRLMRGLRYQRWQLRVEPAPNSTDGVPWNIIAEPLEPNPETDRPGAEMDYAEYANQIPVLRVPEHLWAEWVDGELREAVGIHLHDLQSFDAARVLYTRHMHPTPAGKAPPEQSKRGSRVEGSLLTPLTWWLDQTILVQKDERNKQLAQRLEHERGHAANALRDLIKTISGPGTWNEAELSGQKCKLVWRWRTERLTRTWDGIFGGRKPILTLRTYVDVLPPTRWTLLSDKPADALTARDIKAFNDSLILIDKRYEAARAASAEAFHKKHGGYEQDRVPNFAHPTSGRPALQR